MSKQARITLIIVVLILLGIAVLWFAEKNGGYGAEIEKVVASVKREYGMKLTRTEVSTGTLMHIAGTSSPQITPAGTSSAFTASGTVSRAVASVSIKESSTLKTADELRAITFEELRAMASDTYANEELPLGDNKYVTGAPKKSYIYLCNVHTDNFGAQSNGSWIHDTRWNMREKSSVAGNVSWPSATFSDKLIGSLRMLSGNGLPLGHTTGNFPIASTDPAYQNDRNPNSIKEHALSVNIAANPVYSDTPHCTGGGEVGVMLTGIPIFNGFDAGLRDAAAHELQDSCGGHPQENGEYHYHNMSNCFKDNSVTTILGYALDGFPITGPMVAKNRYLTTEDLDMCHGITSSVMRDGKSVLTYHYVMTLDFPYSISCFRGKPVTVSAGSARESSKTTGGGTSEQAGGQPSNMPPQEAISACSSKTNGASCSFTTAQGDSVTGTCGSPPNSSLACMPVGGPPR